MFLNPRTLKSIIVLNEYEKSESDKLIIDIFNDMFSHYKTHQYLMRNKYA